MADYEEILAMDPDHKIYDGDDYLPAVFKPYMNDPHYIISVCVIEGKIVSSIFNVCTLHHKVSLL